jgi:hypothetical protein
MAPARWIEQYTLRSQAIQNAYVDFNTDCTAGRITPSPLGMGCALTPIVSLSAYASRTFEGVPADPVQCVWLACLAVRSAPFANARTFLAPGSSASRRWTTRTCCSRRTWA